MYALDQVAASAGTTEVTYTASSPDTASGDLIFGFCAWNGSNTGPTVITLAGNDSSGAALALNTADNASSSGSQFWVTGWAQASAPAGPGTDTMTADLGFFAGAGGVMASFKSSAAVTVATPAAVLLPGPVNRTITIPVRAGGGSR